MPTVGHCIVAVDRFKKDCAHGKEQWRFKPEGQPAFRGLTYWNHAPDGQPRLLFNAGEWLYMLDPRNGKPITSFWKARTCSDRPFSSGTGRPQHTHLAERLRVAEATPLPSTLRRVRSDGGFIQGLGLVNMAMKPGVRWKLEPTIGVVPALDSSRGIFYLTTGSPKPNFIGNSHRGDNLFSNCVIALDATSGKRLWHFQEISHDIWDLDLRPHPFWFRSIAATSWWMQWPR